jgi:hypothetical protein
MRSLIDLYRQSGWAFRVYHFFLIAVVLYSFVRIVLSSRSLWFRPLRPIQGAKESANANQLARAALKGLFPTEFPDPSVQFTARFEYLAARLASNLQSLRRLAICTSMASAISFFLGVYSSVAYIYGPPVFSILSGLTLTAMASLLGMIVAFWVYLIASLFEAKLARRRAEWAYLLKTRN